MRNEARVLLTDPQTSLVEGLARADARIELQVRVRRTEINKHRGEKLEMLGER